MTEKRSSDIAACKVADGSKQHTYDDYDNPDGSSPTMVTESIFMTEVIDAKEEREVAVLDTVNAFLQTDTDETNNMLLRGKLAEMAVRIDPALYREYVTYSVNCAHTVREAVQSSVRDIGGFSVVLQEVEKHPGKHGI